MNPHARTSTWPKPRLGLETTVFESFIQYLELLRVRFFVFLQKEFSKRLSDRQEIDLLIWDAYEKCKWAGKEALP